MHLQSLDNQSKTGNNPSMVTHYFSCVTGWSYPFLNKITNHVFVDTILSSRTYQKQR